MIQSRMPRIWVAEVVRLPLHSPTRNWNVPGTEVSRLPLRRARAGFTLIELLVTISIIAILMSFMLGAIFASQEAAREARTKGTITRLHNLIMERWEVYRTRRLPIDTSTLTPAQAARARLDAVRQVMRMEMPDCYADLTFAPTYSNLSNTIPARPLSASTPFPISSLRNAYRNVPGWATRTAKHESAECLYLLVTVGMTAEERGDFKFRDIGDTDKDRMPEFLDGWERPISWLRWAPGFISDFQTQNPNTDHDYFDPLQLEVRNNTANRPAFLPDGTIVSPTAKNAWGFALVPLVVSAGVDGQLGLWHIEWDAPPPGPHQLSNPYTLYNTFWRGEPNITNGIVHRDNIIGGRR